MAFMGEWDDWMMLLSSPACAVPVVSLFHPTLPTCVLPAYELRWTSPRESRSKSQCTSANSVKGQLEVKIRFFKNNMILELNYGIAFCWKPLTGTRNSRGKATKEVSISIFFHAGIYSLQPPGCSVPLSQGNCWHFAWKKSRAPWPK